MPLEGEITVPGLKTDDDELSTLDEPVKDTIVMLHYFILHLYHF